MDDVLSLNDFLKHFTPQEQTIIVEMVSNVIKCVNDEHPNIQLSQNGALEIILKTIRWQDDPKDYRPKWRTENERLDD